MLNIISASMNYAFMKKYRADMPLLSKEDIKERNILSLNRILKHMSKNKNIAEFCETLGDPGGNYSAWNGNWPNPPTLHIGPKLLLLKYQNKKNIGAMIIVSKTFLLKNPKYFDSKDVVYCGEKERQSLWSNEFLKNILPEYEVGFKLTYFMTSECKIEKVNKDS